MTSDYPGRRILPGEGNPVDLARRAFSRTNPGNPIEVARDGEEALALVDRREAGHPAPVITSSSTGAY